MMNFGFISLLLTISEVPISKICINEAIVNSFHPCKDPTELVEPAFSSATEIAGFSNETMDETCLPGGGFFLT
jgi:mlo protein